MRLMAADAGGGRTSLIVVFFSPAPHCCLRLCRLPSQLAPALRNSSSSVSLMGKKL